ncbi:MAG: hypothetical protein VYA67_22150 [Actinomycetota bacterium]|nr:hypothetical protein [Actinomycetota bacterium]
MTQHPSIADVEAWARRTADEFIGAGIRPELLDRDLYDDEDDYAIATAQAALADPNDEGWEIGGGTTVPETEYAIEADRGCYPLCTDDELAGAIEVLADFRPTARLITRQITYGPWRYVTPEEIRNA